jgi:hypothetical protein
MENRLSYLTAFVYTVGVLVTGMWIAEVQIPDLTPFRIVAMVVVGGAWSAYFGWKVGPQIVDLETEDEEDEDEDGGAGGQGPQGREDSDRLDPTQA